MKFKATPGTSKLMTGTLAPKATLGAYLRGTLGVNQGYLPLTFSFIFGKGKKHPSRPSVKPPVPGMATSFTLAKVEVLKDKHTVPGCPLYQLFGGGVAEILGAAGLFALQTFEGSGNRFGTLALYLTGLKPLLKPLYRLASSLVFNPPLKTGDEKFPTIGVNGNQSISLVEVYANRKNAGRIWNLYGKGDIANKLAIPDLYRDAIYPLSIGQHRLEVVGNGIAKALPTSYRPDRKSAILPEVGIPASLADKEQSKGAPKPDRPFELVSVALGGNIRSSNKSYSSAGKLGREPALDRVVGSFVKVKSLERLAIIPAYWRNPVGDLSKCLKGCLEIIVRLYDYLSSALTIQRGHVTTILEKYQIFSGKEVKGAFLCRLKVTVPCA